VGVIKEGGGKGMGKVDDPDERRCAVGIFNYFRLWAATHT